jgi:large subunit ribosomal protein L29
MKLGHTVTPLENPIQIRDVRKHIARLNTELRKREIQA